MPEPDPVKLPFYCAHCGQAVTLQMSDGPTDEGRVDTTHAALETASWQCPYCTRVNDAGVPGRVAFARKGHGQ